MKKLQIFIFIFFSLPLSSQISTWTWTKKLLVQNKIKEIKTFTTENKEINSMEVHFFINDSGLVNRQIGLTYNENKLDTLSIYNYVFDSLNRKSKCILTQEGKTYVSNYFYPDTNTTIIKYNDNGVLSESIEKHYYKKRKEKWKIYYNGKHTLTIQKKGLQSANKYVEHRKPAKSLTKTIDYLDSKKRISKTVYVSYRLRALKIAKETITMTYNDQNELIKTSSISNRSKTPFFEYYECVKK